MKRIITQENQSFINQLKNDLLNEIESKNIEKLKMSTVNSLLNFSKSLKIIPSSSIKGMNLEMITN
jgi:hypothetical protein